MLNNLSEADFELAQVSVVMSDPKLRDAIAPDTGPLKGARLENLPVKLVQAGLPEADAKPYSDAITQGKVLVAIAAPAGLLTVAQEMLQDHSAQLIRGLT